MMQNKIPAALLAVMVHLIFFSVLIFGFRWQAREPAVLEASVWHDLPPIETRHESKPEPIVRKPAPEPAPKPEVQDPEIALKKAREEKRKQQEKLKEEKERIKEKQIKEEKLKEEKLKERKLNASKELKAQQKAKNEADALMKQVQDREASARAGLISQYKARIMSRIRRYVVVPPGMTGNPEAEFDVVLLPGGDVLRATIRKSSGNAAYDAAVERAILRASPLPLPPDASLFDEFRNLDLHFKPDE